MSDKEILVFETPDMLNIVINMFDFSYKDYELTKFIEDILIISKKVIFDIDGDDLYTDIVILIKDFVDRFKLNDNLVLIVDYIKTIAIEISSILLLHGIIDRTLYVTSHNEYKIVIEAILLNNRHIASP